MGGSATLAMSAAGIILASLLILTSQEDPGIAIRRDHLLKRRRKPTREEWRDRLLRHLAEIPFPKRLGHLIGDWTLVWAGVDLSREQFLGLWWMSIIQGFSTGILIILGTSGSSAGWWMGIILSISASMGPYYYLHRRIKTRRRIIDKELPDFLDMLTLALEAGLGLFPALEKVSVRYQGILTEELALTLDRLELGYSYQAAFEELSARVPSENLECLIQALLMALRLGTSLAHTLRIQSNLLRARRRQKAAEMAQTSPIRIIPALVFFFLPGLLLVYLAPPIINLLLGP